MKKKRKALRTPEEKARSDEIARRLVQRIQERETEAERRRASS
jgi:hypothetical protein